LDGSNGFLKVNNYQQLKTIIIMAIAKLMPGIESISGRIGDLVFRTSKKTGKTYVSLQPRKKRIKN